MKKRTFAPLVALTLSAMTGSALATTIGLPGGTFATTWDTFPYVPGPPAAPNFTADTPDSSTGQITATLGEAMNGGMITGSGDRIYAMGTPFDLTVSGTANTTIPLIGIVLKFTPPSTGVADAANYFNVLLDGVAADVKVLKGTSLEGTNDFQIYHWYWTDANLVNGNSFQFKITGGAEHVSLDAIQVVPEPGSAVLGALGAALLVIRRRRK
ncbi:PEP-CTERM sorting domain-containing protein [Luteolibacter flavescens]|uniref:PEP-CTERM sorting domain-containing protein n=1 Tax=Luteolibacter flavescens TaxID=1859460 RepID=A0ABT3FL91_9BACT|nr:PEP-CTERM sorting domain-containing protein [Luteolibacter flavescens]MCW1884352.1 PEP-CTERM sorting domain-containing protein [Luteolibacter flavescens]